MIHCQYRLYDRDWHGKIVLSERFFRDIVLKVVRRNTYVKSYATNCSA